jgi:hypothetical protein
MHARLHEPDQNDGGVGLRAATYLGNKKQAKTAAGYSLYYRI